MGSGEKERLDKLLVESGLAESRHQAEALILAGLVLVNDTPVVKAGTKVPAQAKLRLKEKPRRFVSRGGEKIDAAFDYFGVHLDGVVAVDIGASTGGFTDCMLQRGAKQVYAVDVGFNQLDLKLRNDRRVVVMEKTHAREIVPSQFEPSPTFATVDVSFIGLRKVLKPVCDVLRGPKQIIALVKPQFELGPEYVAKGGVVRAKEDQLLAVQHVTDFAAALGWRVHGSFPSPLKGEKKGNQEYFVYMSGD